jgi:hypothetical protein
MSARIAACECVAFERLSRVESAATVQIGSSARGLLLAWAPTGSTVEQVNANLVDEGLSATRPVSHGCWNGFSDLVLFFEAMERDWRGWDGTRAWMSHEGDLLIEARHELGHVQLSVTLRHTAADRGGVGWSASVVLAVDPGEELSQVVRDVQALSPV